MTPGKPGNAVLVIPVFNGLPQLQRCLAALAWAPDLGVELVVVDAGSSDGSLAAVAELAPWAHVVHGDGSMWWAAAVDRGVRHAADTLGADRVCLLNHDCELTGAAYVELCRVADLHPGDIVCSHVVERGSNVTTFAGGVVRRSGMLAIRGMGAPDGAVFPSGIVDWCGGMGVVVPVALLRTLGGFDAHAFPHYYADADLCLRARSRGACAWFCGAAKVTNDTRSSGHQLTREGTDLGEIWRGLTSRKSMYNLRDTTLFYARHGGLRAPLALANVYGLWAGMALTRLLRSLRGSAAA